MRGPGPRSPRRSGTRGGPTPARAGPGQSAKSPARPISSTAASTGLADPGIPRRAEGHELLDRHRPSGLHCSGRSTAASPGSTASTRDRPSRRPVDQHAVPRGQPDADPRLVGLGPEGHGPVAHRGLGRCEVAAVEPAVAGHAVVGHPAVQPRPDGSVPDQFSETRVQSQAGEARVAHGDQPPLGDARPPSLLVLDPEPAGEDTAPEVEFLHVVGDGDGGEVQPGAVPDPEGERLPVGQVDDALVLHPVAVDVVGEPVEHPRGVRAGVVAAAGAALGRRGARDEPAVAERAERLPAAPPRPGPSRRTAAASRSPPPPALRHP